MKTRKTLSEIIQTMEKSRPGKVLLCPLAMIAFLFQLLVKLKAYLYRTGLLKADELNCRVICVGNITSGGTGKTPAVQLLARRMQRQGLKVVIISRGYKGSLRGKLAVVADEEQVLRQPKEVGDEPYLLARHLPGIPIVVAKKRWRAGIYACARFDPQVIILDDGYQHQKLARQVNIMVIDATNPFGNYRLIPRGILREPLPALARAQVFLLTKTDLAQDSSSLIKTLKHYNPEAPVGEPAKSIL
jgi:tetraacyldisaccharide 4'-kinase